MNRHLAWRVLALGTLVATPVYPCGGPEHYDISAPLVRPERFLEAIEVDFDGLESRKRSELRFLAPFVAAKRTGASALWMWAYQDQAPPAATPLDTSETFGVDARVAAFDRATTTGKIDEMRDAADALLRALLNTPSVVADGYHAPAQRAVELLEVASVATREHERLLHTLFGVDSSHSVDTTKVPQWARDVVTTRSLTRSQLAAWGATHPQALRAPAAAWADIGEAMRSGIPNGWAREVRDSVPADRWRALAFLHANWLAHYAQHPMSPWVRLSRAHLAYFQGDTVTAWNTLLDLYASSPVRAVAEMRYLLQQEVRIPSLDDPRIDDVLRAALLAEVAVTPAQWTSYWRRAEGESPGGRREAWRRLTKERLLWQAAGGLRAPEQRATDVRTATLTLPVGFPSSPNGLSPLGAAFRALALTRAGRHLEAIEQVDALGDDSLVAPLRAHLLLDARRWSDAIAVKHLETQARDYVLRILAPDSVVAAIRVGKDERLAGIAARTQALRVVARGAWREGAALLPPSEAKRRAAWLEAASRSADTTISGTLAYARWLRTRHGALLGTPDKVWYRSVSWRIPELTAREGNPSEFDEHLPWTAAEEQRAIVDELAASYEMFHAMRAYVRVLERMPAGDPRVTAVVREANVAYNWLASWDNNNSSVFQDEMERAGIGGIIRRAGKRR